MSLTSRAVIALAGASLLAPASAAPQELSEFACHEGNYSMPGMLTGARAEESVANR